MYRSGSGRASLHEQAGHQTVLQHGRAVVQAFLQHLDRLGRDRVLVLLDMGEGEAAGRKIVLVHAAGPQAVRPQLDALQLGRGDQTGQDAELGADQAVQPRALLAQEGAQAGMTGVSGRLSVMARAE